MTGVYFTLPATVVNVDDSFVPTEVTAVMITIEMSAAIRPYSMAVAADLDRRKRDNKSVMLPIMRANT